MIHLGSRPNDGAYCARCILDNNKGERLQVLEVITGNECISMRMRSEMKRHETTAMSTRQHARMGRMTTVQNNQCMLWWKMMEPSFSGPFIHGVVGVPDVVQSRSTHAATRSRLNPAGHRLHPSPLWQTSNTNSQHRSTRSRKAGQVLLALCLC